MACINCDKIRAAILHGRMAEAAGLTLDVFREKMGLFDNTEKGAEGFTHISDIGEVAVAHAKPTKVK